MKTKQIFIFNEYEGWTHVGDEDDMKNALDYIKSEIAFHSDEDNEFQIRVRVKAMTPGEVDAMPAV